MENLTDKIISAKLHYESLNRAEKYMHVVEALQEISEQATRNNWNPEQILRNMTNTINANKILANMELKKE